MQRLKIERFAPGAVPGALLGMLVVCLLALAPAALASTPPVVTGAAVSPSSLPSSGGTVTVDAQASDPEGQPVDFVVVRMSSGSSWSETALSRGGGTDEWTGQVDVPFNLGPEPVTWRFTIVARDLDGDEGSGDAGTVEVAAGHGFDEAPSVFDPAVSPRDLPSAGGAVALAVSATDDTGLTDMYANVTDAEGGVTRVALEPVGGDRFAGTFQAPPAAGTASVTYAVRMAAVDSIGQVGDVNAGTITVAGQPSGRLQLDRSALDFGTAKVGTRTQRPIVLRNVGARGTAPVHGVITTVGAGFRVVGAPAAGLPFTLRAGERLTLHVELRPSAAGPQTGALLVTRPDLVQAPLSVGLSGVGVVRGAAAK